MSNRFDRILEPKIINDKFEGKHAIVHMTDMRTLIECIYENELFSREREGRKKWQYGANIVGRENLKRALTIGRTSDSMMRLYQKLRASIDTRIDVSKFVGKGLSCKRKRVSRDDGDDLSMSRLMGGSDQYWETTIRKSKRANVRIGMNMAISHEHRERDFARLGATLACICDVITKLGYGVEVIAYNFVRYVGKHKWKHWGMSVPIKMPNEPMDIHRLMTAGLPGLFRDYMFGLMEKKYKFGYSLGRQCETTDTYKRELNLIHAVEQRFCKTDDDTIDGLEKALQTIANPPKWMSIN